MKRKNNNEYKIITGVSGEPVLIKYNKKYKTWIKLHFSENGAELSEHVMNILGTRYIEETVDRMI